MTPIIHTCVHPPTITKRWRSSLLTVSLCVLLISCDDSSFSADSTIISAFASVDSDRQRPATSLQEDHASSVTTPAPNMAEGQSLITAAQSSKSRHADSERASAAPRDSMLQAILIGDYGGMVPCGDCGSIDVTLNLFADGSVLKASHYHNPEHPRAPLLESGIYRQDSNKIAIVYEGQNIETYHIQDSHLILMDEYDNVDNDYTLSRQ